MENPFFFGGKYLQHGEFSMAMLVYRSVGLEKKLMAQQCRKDR